MAIYDIDKPNLKYPEIKGCFVRLEDIKKCIEEENMSYIITLNICIDTVMKTKQKI